MLQILQTLSLSSDLDISAPRLLSCLMYPDMWGIQSHLNISHNPKKLSDCCFLWKSCCWMFLAVFAQFWHSWKLHGSSLSNRHPKRFIVCRFKYDIISNLYWFVVFLGCTQCRNLKIITISGRADRCQRSRSDPPLPTPSDGLQMK